MKRLTTDKNASEMSMIELAHNSCYADKERRARYRDYELDIDARDLAKMLINDMCNEDLSSMTDEEFDNYIKEMLADGMNSQIGLIALFYRNVWAMTDLREKLADYEDTGMTPGQVIEMQMDWVAMKAACPKWIPITEKLPKEDGTYLVTFSNGTRSIVGYGTCRMTIFGRPIGHGWYNLHEGSYYADGCVIAWMPLPEPYRG